MARARNGRFGKAIDERVDVGAVLRKGAHDKRLYTSELTQTALDGAGAHLLAIWPELTVEALGVSDSIYRHCPRPSVRCTTRCPLSWTSPVRTSTSSWCSAPVAVVQSLHLEEDCLHPGREFDLQIYHYPTSRGITSVRGSCLRALLTTWEVRLRTAELRIGVCCVSRRPLLVSTPFRDDLLRQGHKEQVLEFLCCLPIHPLGPTDYCGLKGTVLYSPPPIKRSAGEFRLPICRQ